MAERKQQHGSKPHDEVEDPHSSNEEHYDRQERPGGASPPKDDLGPNPHIHRDGVRTK